ncbi:MAG: hypothetical protein LPK46_05440, partial [Bacteroidota bacterium]|nr:hypothetical protein [Bacteroidota bacterium]MDX5505565.1 hypothetical protein [Bacteroidota bacterium]
LQLSGPLGPGTTIRASITDNNIPVQADGTTQNLREFDQVFIEIENDPLGILRAGDYQIQGTNGRFLRFSKRISGAGLKTGFEGLGGRFDVHANGALARGKFARNIFFGREGDQGPYKLRGNNDELFIILISGSERVYIDGVLLTRGLENDYTIDYNTGEVTFTPLRPITRESRIIVEFQYTEQNYLRTLVYGGAGWQDDRFGISLDIYNEADQRSQPLRGEFSPEEQQALVNAGNDPLQAFVPGWSPANFDPSLIQYRITDSTGVDTVFVFSRDSTQQLFNVSFSYYGPNQGDYVIDTRQAINGRVYRFVPRVNGVPQGDFRPVRKLPTPNSLLITTGTLTFRPTDQWETGLELAISKRDQNLFGAGETYGTGGRLFSKGKHKWGEWTLGSDISAEWVQKDYETVERLRQVEFGRDWNIRNLPRTDQVYAEAGITARSGASTSLGFRSEALMLDSLYQGFRQNLAAGYKDEHWVIRANASLLTARDTAGNILFARQITDLRYFIGRPYLGIRSTGEWNQLSANDPRQRSYRFFEGEFFTGYGDTAVNYTEIFGFRRNDDSVYSEDLEGAALAWGYGARGKVRRSDWGTLEYSVKYREFDLARESYGEDRNTTTGRLKYQHRLLRNALSFSVFYEASLSNEPGREFRYIPVPAGTGTHTWKDYNGNGLQELEEFEPAQFPDEARFLRTFVLTNRFVPASYTNISPSLNFTFRNLQGIPNWLNPVSIQSFYQRSQKTLLTGSNNQLDPFAPLSVDSNLIAFTENIRNTVFFNRGVPTFNADLTIQQTATTNLASLGLEGTNVREHVLNFRGLVSGVFPLEMKSVYSTRENESSTLTNRNYFLDRYELTPSVGYQPNTEVKILVRGTWQSQINRADSGEELDQWIGGIELQWNNSRTLTLLARADLVENNFTGNSNSPVGYQMLAGLQPGTNGVWELNLQKNVNNFIRVTLSYQGRASETANVIHTGNVQIRAFF